MTFKENIYALYNRRLDEKIEHLQKNLQDLGNSAANETKSTAGDKHETALAMLQIEQQNKRAQLAQLLAQRDIFKKIDPRNSSAAVLNGSLVQTDKGYFYICTALGKLMLDDRAIFALSPTSPLGQKLMGKNTGQTVEMNNIFYTVLSVE
jgi:transcription elongation GreA/GreB family factor